MSINSQSQQHHQMQLEKTYPSGAEEWLCPTCRRRFLLHFKPENRQLDIHVLEAGDKYIRHTGSKGGLCISKSEICVPDEEPGLSDELRSALEETLDDLDLND